MYKMLGYGAGGSGKTTLGISSFWDFDNYEVLDKGIWIRLGQERNDSLRVPDEYVQRFAVDPSKPMNFVGELRARERRNYLSQINIYIYEVKEISLLQTASQDSYEISH